MKAEEREVVMVSPIILHIPGKQKSKYLTKHLQYFSFYQALRCLSSVYWKRKLGDNDEYLKAAILHLISMF